MDSKTDDVKDIDARIVDLYTMFEPSISYRIPQFQRPYAWGKDGQWKPLWDDIRAVAVRCLNEKKDEKKIRPHFMGAIVLQQQNSNSGEVAKRIVVDGQQRLTTLQLLIKAVEQAFRSQDDIIRADEFRRLIVNQERYWDGDSNNAFKIRQSNLNDQAAFQAAISNHDSSGQSQSWAISQAYMYLKDLVGNWLDNRLEDREARARALEETLTKHLQIAVIELHEDEKPHIVFETLNARGEPLKQSDLIKNTIMYEAKVIDDAQKARELWGMFDDEWWRQDTGETGSNSRVHIDRFLNYWMVMRKLESVTADRVASEFRNYIQDKQPSPETVAADIKSTGIVYKNLEQVKISEIDTFLQRIKVMKLGVVTPLLLWLYTSEVPLEQRLRSVKALESYLVRRMLCSLSSNSMDIFFVSLLKELGNDRINHVDKFIIKFLGDQTTDSRVWPNDFMLYERLIERPMKGVPNRKKMVLEAIEMSLRSKKSELLGATDKLTVEHIMPKRWEKNWPIPTDVSDEAAAERIRNEAIETIGNLTLTTDKLNSSLSNGQWSVKRQALDNHSILFLNRTLLKKNPGVWDEAAIQKRSEYLAKVIMQIWPSAETFTTTSV